MTKTKSLLMTYEDFLSAVPEGSRDKAIGMYFISSFKRIVISGIVFFFISLFSLINDFISGFYNRADEPLNFLNLIALSILAIGSAAIIVIGIFAAKKPLSIKAYKLCHWAYYIVMDVALALLFLNQFSRGYCISYSQFYWLFFAVVPLPHLRSNIFNVSISAVVYIAEFIAVSFFRAPSVSESIYFLPLLAAFGIFGLYLRNFYLKTIVFTLRNQELTEQLRSRSRVDSLTGCLNRYVMNERFEALRETVQTLSVFMLDIDDFKEYNDGFDHLKGDECLCSVSKCVSEICSSKSADIFRYGGEEFVVFSAEMNEIETLKFADGIVSAVNALRIHMPEPFADKHPYLTVSLGAAIVKLNHDSNMKDVITEADRQLYIAKGRGKNCVCYHNSIRKPNG